MRKQKQSFPENIQNDVLREREGGLLMTNGAYTRNNRDDLLNRFVSLVVLLSHLKVM